MSVVISDLKMDQEFIQTLIDRLKWHLNNPDVSYEDDLKRMILFYCNNTECYECYLRKVFGRCPVTKRI